MRSLPIGSSIDRNGRQMTPLHSPREGARSKVSGQRVLRSARRRAGQIRDAASRLYQQGVGDGGLRRVRCFQADLLTTRPRWTSIWPALQEWCRRSHGPAVPTRSTTRSWHFCRHLRPRRTRSRPGACQAAPPGTRYRASSQIDRAGSKKKRQVDIAATAACRSNRRPSHPSTRYCARLLSAQRCRLRHVAACCSFCAGACGDGLRR